MTASELHLLAFLHNLGEGDDIVALIELGMQADPIFSLPPSPIIPSPCLAPVSHLLPSLNPSHSTLLTQYGRHHSPDPSPCASSGRECPSHHNRRCTDDPISGHSCRSHPLHQILHHHHILATSDEAAIIVHRCSYQWQTPSCGEAVCARRGNERREERGEARHEEGAETLAVDPF